MLGEGEGFGMGSLRNGFGVGFLGDVAFRENKPPILIGFLR